MSHSRRRRWDNIIRQSIPLATEKSSCNFHSTEVGQFNVFLSFSLVDDVGGGRATREDMSIVWINDNSADFFHCSSLTFLSLHKSRHYNSLYIKWNCYTHISAVSDSSEFLISINFVSFAKCQSFICRDDDEEFSHEMRMCVAIFVWKIHWKNATCEMRKFLYCLRQTSYYTCHICSSCGALQFQRDV